MSSELSPLAYSVFTDQQVMGSTLIMAGDVHIQILDIGTHFTLMTRCGRKRKQAEYYTRLLSWTIAHYISGTLKENDSIALNVDTNLPTVSTRYLLR